MDAPPADDVAARYAPRRTARSRWTGRALAVAGVVAVGAAFASVTASVAGPEVRWRDVAFDVLSPELVQVTFEVYGEQGQTVRCQVRAADVRYGDVGQLDVDLGPLPAGGEQATVDVRTLAPAASASVRTCVALP
ncbi:DUF4307 domain-containing protein [Aquipuribacter hungaricus]|uniref:DUF4307 domain-containing protein n=1 Tax=Aquipuribacter hungaricus TaxID=545624 RepID=A0ABV7WD68_9MICO